MFELENFLEKVQLYVNNPKEKCDYALEVEKLISICKLQLEALEEIDWMFDGEADIDNNGMANRAMTINSIVSAVTTKSNAIASEKETP